MVFELFCILRQQQQIKYMEKFKIGDYLLHKRFGWQYKIVSIRNGVAVIQDIVRDNVRIRFTLGALSKRVELESYLHSPYPF